MESGNLEPKKSAFRVRTKLGSSQGMRQSQMQGEMGDGIGLAPVITRPMTRGEDKDKLRDSVMIKQNGRDGDT